MVSTETPLCDFNTDAVEFDLLGVDGKKYSLANALERKAY